MQKDPGSRGTATSWLDADEPMALFRDWWALAQAQSPLRHPKAVCVSTVDGDGNPDARFVDLKEVRTNGLVFCTQFDSRKGAALDVNPHVAMTFWWDHIERQVRAYGVAERVSATDADRLFESRPRDAQLASWASKQSAPLDETRLLEQRLAELRERFDQAPIPRPENWGGYLVELTRVEFLRFRESRLHERLLFQRAGDGWQKLSLQP
jgi:pyridoxamine 5'-phosphate oxidase